LIRPFALAGIGVAVLVAAGVVVTGTVLEDGRPVAKGATAAASLPPGHPAVTDDTAATPIPTRDAVALRIRRLEKAHAATPEDVGILLSLGDAHFLRQDYAQAAKAYRGVLRLKPGDATASVRLAMVWHAGGHSRRAVAAIEGVLNDDPNDQEAHYSLAIVYFSEGRVSEARSEWSTAARLDPSSELGRRSESFVELLAGKEPAAPEGGD
jgi:cytochrome c-type biogenesis protein CcmH/NrfG